MDYFSSVQSQFVLYSWIVFLAHHTSRAHSDSCPSSSVPSSHLRRPSFLLLSSSRIRPRESNLHERVRQAAGASASASPSTQGWSPHGLQNFRSPRTSASSNTTVQHIHAIVSSHPYWPLKFRWPVESTSRFWICYRLSYFLQGGAFYFHGYPQYLSPKNKSSDYCSMPSSIVASEGTRCQRSCFRPTFQFSSFTFQ